MADDIDIEEHDLLENPAIRSIFPDISVLKKEISLYYEDVLNIKQEPDINKNNEKSSGNPIISSSTQNVEKELSQKVCPSEATVDHHGAIQYPEQIAKQAQGNKIILGSKPNKTLQQTEYGNIDDVVKGPTVSEESVIRIPKVVLQDLGAYIYHNNRYCKDCQTLFPSRSDLDDHKRRVHCLKTKNKRGKVPTNRNQTKNKCSICGVCFSCNSNLHRHYRNVHRKKITSEPKHKNNSTMIRTNDPSCVSNKLIRSQSKNIKKIAKNICFHCKKPFPDHKSLIEHIYNVLEPKLCPKVSSKKLRSHIIYEKAIKKPIDSMIDENQDEIVPQTLREKLTFEIHDSDASDSQVLEDEENMVDLESIITPNKKKYLSLSTTTQQVKRKLADSNESESTDTSKMNTNVLTPCCKSLNKRQKIEMEKQNGYPTRKKTDKNQEFNKTDDLKSTSDSPDLMSKLDSPRPKTIKTKRKTSEKKQLSIKSENIKDKVRFHESDENNSKKRLIYECIYCTYILPTARAYQKHLVRKHKVRKNLRANRVAFEEQCKFCPSKSKRDNARNKHLYFYHHDLLFRHFPNEVGEGKSIKYTNPAFKMFESFVLETIIYKCNKCDVHFLSSCIAKDHEKHMELLINWKCSICHRIFKKHDKYLHLKQHNFSKKLNVCQFNESELSRLLYNCTKCAIHFTEERYLEHYSKCEDKTADSVYCKYCDVLIDKYGYKNHETYHKMGTNTADFTVIVADIIEIPKSEEIVKKRTRRYEQVKCLTFCPTCKCYLTDLGLTHKTHIESRCSKITKYTCNICGLVFTNKAIGTHRDHHKKESGLKLQSYKFFDLKGIQINPPLPEYPCCTNCDVIFVSRNAVLNHICSDIEFFTCSICNIKLSENAFKLHMNFHNYSMVKVGKDSSHADAASESQEQQIVPAQRKVTANNLNNGTKRNVMVVNHINNEDDTINNIVYSCQSCKIAVNGYDEVIEHCQGHLNNSTTTTTLTMKICSKCSLKFENDAHKIHQKLHVRYDTLQFLTFDPTYFTSDNNVWIQHIFASIPESVKRDIIAKSIYRYECRIKMEVVQKGPSYLTVYKCSKCGTFIDPDCLFAHVKDSCSKYVRKYPCSVCGLPFMAKIFRSKHEEIHKRYDRARLKSYNIVLINCEEHNSYNTKVINAVNNYVLYQCRTCEGIVEQFQRNVHRCNVDDLRKCPICKLLLYKDDFERHISKHSDLAKFNTKNMKVIVFGEKNDSIVHKAKSPSFAGVVHDYTLYKCAMCEICVDTKVSIKRHVCASDDSKSKCSKCDFYFCAQTSLKQHIKMHDLDSYFKTENIKVVHFGIDNEINSKETRGTTFTTDIESDNAKEEHQEKSNVEGNNTNSEKAPVILFKCVCGLHYMDKLNCDNHLKHCSPKIKIIRQTCSKCSLVFNPTELFSHILAHHGDKNKTINYKIIDLFPERENAQ